MLLFPGSWLRIQSPVWYDGFMTSLKIQLNLVPTISHISCFCSGQKVQIFEYISSRVIHWPLTQWPPWRSGQFRQHIDCYLILLIVVSLKWFNWWLRGHDGTKNNISNIYRNLLKRNKFHSFWQCIISVMICLRFQSIWLIIEKIIGQKWDIFNFEDGEPCLINRSPERKKTNKLPFLSLIICHLSSYYLHQYDPSSLVVTSWLLQCIVVAASAIWEICTSDQNSGMERTSRISERFCCNFASSCSSQNNPKCGHQSEYSKISTTKMPNCDKITIFKNCWGIFKFEASLAASLIGFWNKLCHTDWKWMMKVCNWRCMKVPRLAYYSPGYMCIKHLSI